MSMEPERITEKQEKMLLILEEKFPDLPPREEIISVFQETQLIAQGNTVYFYSSGTLQMYYVFTAR